MRRNPRESSGGPPSILVKTASFCLQPGGDGCIQWQGHVQLPCRCEEMERELDKSNCSVQGEGQWEEMPPCLQDLGVCCSLPLQRAFWYLFSAAPEMSNKPRSCWHLEVKMFWPTNCFTFQLKGDKREGNVYFSLYVIFLQKREKTNTDALKISRCRLNYTMPRSKQ